VQFEHIYNIVISTAAITTQFQCCYNISHVSVHNRVSIIQRLNWTGWQSMYGKRLRAYSSMRTASNVKP